MCDDSNTPGCKAEDGLCALVCIIISSSTGRGTLLGRAEMTGGAISGFACTPSMGVEPASIPRVLRNELSANTTQFTPSKCLLLRVFTANSLTVPKVLWKNRPPYEASNKPFATYSFINFPFVTHPGLAGQPNISIDVATKSRRLAPQYRPAEICATLAAYLHYTNLRRLSLVPGATGVSSSSHASLPYQ
ncbi:uncharacterized protein EI90DRAFT_1949894 [Cantharellus anzutake]|uniref:uncharacterized protein n=1 Tax=Cantharellus anzutake TaxID=1750568 RepID=UPI0019087AE4|nr:uncharacterized protein EI90DRAFT_1949894 [Cantharellus anzutake]KAF8326395.1 hypothetical protein EI90DRAFT_1949894 [Cantharellus anzutake]